MAVERVGKTAIGATLIKALEAHAPAPLRLFEDRLSARLLPATARAFVEVGVLRQSFLGLMHWRLNEAASRQRTS